MDLGTFLSHTLSLKIGQDDKGLPKRVDSYLDFERMMQHGSHRGLMGRYMALYERRRSFIHNADGDRIHRYWLIWKAIHLSDRQMSF